MKWKLILFMMFISINIIYAEEICTDATSYMNCTIVTPSISCDTYNYTIIDISTGEAILNDTLIWLKEDIYYFIFNQTVGEYTIRLCDGSTKQVSVSGGNNMWQGSLILIPVIFGLFCLVGAATLGKQHDVLRTALFLLSLITVLGSVYLSSVVIASSNPIVQNALGVTQSWIGYAIFVIVIYFLLYLIYKGFQLAAQKKQEKIEY